jgi:uncharacterized iron-regulated protein
MMHRASRIFFLTLFSFLFIAADKPLYNLFDSQGKKVNFDKMLKEAAKADVLLFGELHDNPVVHWLQLELLQALYEKSTKHLILGAEMFESDEQYKIDEYLHALIDEKYFEREARLWPNYKTDYRPLMRFAREKGLPFIASNIPRRYASLVAVKGLQALDTFSDNTKAFFAPLPIKPDMELQSYKAMHSMPMHGMRYLAEAQAAKDATMAYFILKNLGEQSLFIHFNGTYHSDNYEGIYWFLKKEQSDLKIMTIASVYQDDIAFLSDDNKGKADFVIVTQSNITKTH